MLLRYHQNGNLIPGVHEISWINFENEFGYNMHRSVLIYGLKLAIAELSDCGCRTIFIDGSFVTKKVLPNDYDACWDPTGVNLAKLTTQYPTLVDFSNRRVNQKYKYKGELFPATIIAVPPKEIYIDFFQHDKDGNPKGIIKLRI